MGVLRRLRHQPQGATAPRSNTGGGAGGSAQPLPPAVPRRRRCWLVVTVWVLAALGSSFAGAHTRITTDITWGSEIRTLLRQHCMRCHRPGGIAPSYADFLQYGTDSQPGARAWAIAIEEEMLTGRMPPWGADSRYGDFLNERRPSPEDIDTIVAWVRGGAPQGPRRNLPAPEEFAGDWELGNPDVEIVPAEPYAVPMQAPGIQSAGIQSAESTLEFELPFPGEEDTWIVAFEFGTDQPRAVRRLQAWIVDSDDRPPEALEVEVQIPYDPFRDENQPVPTRWRGTPAGRRLLGQWMPGDAPVLLPTGAGKRIRRGSRVRLVAEYAATPQPITDRPRLGLHLAYTTDEVDLVSETLVVLPDPPASVTAGKSAKRRRKRSAAPTSPSTFPRTLRHQLSESIRLTGLLPRVPDQASSFEVNALFPDSRRITMLYVPEYDARFPASYFLAAPLPLPIGTRIEMSWTCGDCQAGDEASLFVDYTLNDHLVLPPPQITVVPAGPRSSMLAGSFGGALVQPDSSSADAPAADNSSLLASGSNRAGGGDAGTPPADQNAAAHMDHSPLHGGQFFMAPNFFHHLEGALPVAGEFRTYVYDDFKRPIDPRNFAGEIVFERYEEKTGDYSEERFAMAPVAGTDFLAGKIPAELPAEFYASINLAGEPTRFDFYFEKTTVDTGPLRSYRSAGGNHSHQRPPLIIPDNGPGIVLQLGQRVAELESKIAKGDWTFLYVPAFDGRDLAEALLEHLAGIRARDQGLVRRAVSRILQSAAELDRTGDTADEARSRSALERFREAVDELKNVFQR